MNIISLIVSLISGLVVGIFAVALGYSNNAAGIISIQVLTFMYLFLELNKKKEAQKK